MHRLLFAAAACLVLAAESAFALDIQVKAQNETSMADVTYVFDGVPTTVAGTDVTTAVTISGITPGVPQALLTTFGNLVFESDAAGNLTQTGGPAIFSIAGSTITIQNTVSYPTMTVKAANPTTMADARFFLIAGEHGRSGSHAIGDDQTIAGTAVTTGVTFPFEGMAVGQVYSLSTTFGVMGFTLDAAGDVVQTSGPSIFAFSGTPSGSTITIQNTVSYPTMTVKAANPTTMADTRLFLIAGEIGRSGSHAIGDDQTIAGNTVTAGVTFPFEGMAPGQVYGLFTTFGNLGFTLDADGAVVQTSGPPVFAFSGTPSGSTVTIQNTVSFPTLTVNAANPTSINDVRFSLAANEIGRSGIHPIGTVHLVPGTDVPAGVTFPFEGMAAGQLFTLRTTFGNTAFTIDAAGAMTQTLGPPIFTFGAAAATVENDLTQWLFVHSQQPSASDPVVLELKAQEAGRQEYHRVDVLHSVPGSALPAGVSFEMSGMAALQDLHVVTSLGNMSFQLQADGKGLFKPPATPTTPTTMASLAIEGGTNTLVAEFLATPPEEPLLPVFEQPTAPVCDSMFEWVAGKQLAFDVRAFDDNTGDTVTLDVTGFPAGAVLTPALPLTGNPVETAFSWTPGETDAGLHTITFTATDSTGATSTCGFMVTVSFDRDGDGLPDAWELEGYTLLDDGTVAVGDQGAGFVDLPAMGAQVDRKDVFVEVDYMEEAGHSHRPSDLALDLVKTAFANAPVSNPDGTTGITLHVLVGDPVPHQATLGTGSATDYDWTAFDAIKEQEFPEELGLAVHYCVFAHALPDNASGVSRGNGASDFIVALGLLADQVGSDWQQAGTFMHEFGHNLGLGHGGGDDQDHKPNYLSVMNRAFQMSGLRIDGVDGNFDYSFVRIDLDERSVTESSGLAGPPGVALYNTSWFRYDQQLWSGPVNGPIDWNNDSIPLSVPIEIDVTDDGAKTFLSGHDDWANLVFTGGRVGAGVALPLPEVTEVAEELTVEEVQQLGLAPPTNLHGHVADAHKIVLTWKPVGPQKEASYRIYRGAGGGQPIPVGDAAQSNFEDTNVAAGNTYTYLVTVVNAEGVESAQAATVHVTFGE